MRVLLLPNAVAVTGSFSTSVTTPLVIGGTAASSTLTLRSTSGVGTTDALIFQVGNNGATEAMRILDSGFVGIGVAAPSTLLHIVGTSPSVRIGSAIAAQTMRLDFYDANTTIKGHVGYAISSTSFDFVNDSATLLRFGCLNNVPVQVLVNSTEVARFTAAGLALNSNATASYALSFSGQAVRTIGMERHTTAETAGNSLTIRPGDAKSGATDKDGGQLILQSGIGTGTGTSTILFKVNPAGSTGTTDTTPTTALTLNSNGSATIAGGVTATTVAGTGIFTPISGTAVTGGGVLAITLGSSAPSITVGSGAPTMSAAQGSIYIRSNGTGAADRAYINTNGSTTWTAIVTVA